MSDEPAVPRHGSTTREIADAVVRLTRQATGRGPVSARVIQDDDAIVVLMHDTMTKAEQTLVDNGRSDEVLALRRAIQDVMRPDLSAEVERITGRNVKTFMSSNHAAPDYAAEIFLMGDPVPGD
jgi:uncharacterized protein YbcI